jgi:hypothetical protein
MSAYLTKAGNLSGLTDLTTARDNLNLGTLNTPVFAGVTAQGSGANVAYLTPTSLTLTHATSGSFTIQPSSGITFPDSTVQTTAFTASTLSGYATESWVTSGFAPLARALPGSGTIGQVLTKNSGTDYDASWATLIPGDRYLTSSTTSLTIDNANKTLTIGTGLSYTTQQDVVISYDATHHMHARVTAYNSSTGVMDVDVISHTGTGTFAVWTVNVGGTVPLASIVWGDITGTLGDQTDLATALNAKLEVTTAASTYLSIVDAASSYYPLTGNPSGFITSSALTGYATESWVTSQGYLTSAPVLSVAGKTGSVTLDNTDISGLGTMATASTSDYSTTTVANGLYYPLSSNPSGYLVAADIAGKANSASPALTGNVTITTNSTSPALFIEQSGTGNILTLHDQASDTTFVAIDQNGKVNTIASTTTNAGFNIPHATAAPSAPVNGDIWTTTSGLFMRQNGSTKQYVDLDGTQTINGTKTFSASSQTLGNSTATGTISVGTGATLSGSTKTVNIGTGGVAGSTTNIAIGSTTGTSTTTLQGITNGVTQSAGDSSLKLATTAFVTTADNLKANLASPTFTGVPAAPTASAGTNTTQIATTAFVTAAVPTAATHTQALQFSSTSAYTKVIDASSQVIAPSILCVWPSPSNYNGTSTSGAGASAALYLTGYVLTSPSAGVAGNARVYHGNIAGDVGYMMWGGTGTSLINFSRRVSMSFRFSQFPSSQYSVTRVLLGKIHGTAVGDLTTRGIGVKYVPTASTFDFYLQVHNGTTLTNVLSSTQYAGGVADLEVVSDGSGNVTLYLNGASVATSSAGPTGNTGNNATVFAEVESTASTTNQPVASVGRLFVNSLNF